MKVQPAKSWRFLLCTALVAGGMVLVVYGLLGVFPFGDGTVITGDLNGQYIPYYAHYKRFFNGEAGFAYGFDKALGGSLLGLFAYYVASPLHLLYLLVPVHSFARMAGLVFGLKTVLAAVSFAYMARRKYPAVGIAAVAAALGYAFSAWVFAYAQNVMWHDVLVLLPLIVLGIDRILGGGRSWLYITALALAVFANFYIAYMACIFAVLYLLWRWAAGGRAAVALKNLARFAAASLLGGGIPMALLLPAVFNVGATKGMSGPAFALGTNFSLEQIAGQFVWGGFRWEDLEHGLPLLYCGTLVLPLLFCYFISNAIPAREKWASGGLVLALVLSLWVTGLDTLWHGGQAAVWFPYRYSFIVCFALLLLGVSALARDAVNLTELALSCGILGICAGLLMFVPNRMARGLSVTTAVFGAVLALLLVVLKFKKGKALGRLAALGIVAVTAVELTANGYMITRQMEPYPDSVYQAFVNDVGGAVAWADGENGQPYRLEKTFFRTQNDGMLVGYKNLSHFGSTQDNANEDILVRLGYRADVSVKIYGTGSTAFADAVLGVKYLLDDGSGQVPAHFDPLDNDTAYPMYQNPYALPLAFAVPGSGMETADAGEESTFAWQNRLYTCVSADEQALFVDAEAVQSGNTVAVTAPGDGYLYLLAEGAMLYDVPMLVNGEEAGRYFSALETGVVNLGWRAAGQTVRVEWQSEGEIVLEGLWAATMGQDKLAALAAEAAGQGVDAHFADGHVTVSLEAEAGQVLFTSIPWDESWAATVNGVAVEPLALLEDFLAVPLNEGANTVELRYAVQGAGAGWALTILCLLAAAAWGGWALYQDKKRKDV